MAGTHKLLDTYIELNSANKLNFVKTQVMLTILHNERGKLQIIEITQCKGFENTTNTKLHALYKTKSADQASIAYTCTYIYIAYARKHILYSETKLHTSTSRSLVSRLRPNTPTQRLGTGSSQFPLCRLLLDSGDLNLSLPLLPLLS